MLKQMDIIYLFLTAFFFAYILEPICRKIRTIIDNKAASTIMTIMFGLLILCGVIILALPILDRELARFKERLPEMISFGYIEIKPIVENLLGSELKKIETFKSEIIAHIKGHSSAFSSTIISFIVSGTNLIVTIIGWLIIIPVSVYYLLKDWDGFTATLIKVIPQSYREDISDICAQADKKLKLYFKGQLLVIGMMALYYTCCLFIIGYESWFAVGLFSAILLLLPYVGFVIAFLLAVLTGILDLGLYMGIVATIIIYSLGQLIEGFFLTPKLVGEQIGLHPLAVIFALLFFGSVMGFTGLIIALPLTAILTTIAIKVLEKMSFNF
ncbi:MAG: hypothetical protein CBC42_07655 [Betaproteobacteria bacterium TMED82]|nr:MAG: hypothetical protein CBC42_07655 [Betaproteobacteria bacterium TMED82]